VEGHLAVGWEDDQPPLRAATIPRVTYVIAIRHPELDRPGVVPAHEDCSRHDVFL
jgi:hypothetical protein